jgi:hypothetical protein
LPVGAETTAAGSGKLSALPTAQVAMTLAQDDASLLTEAARWIRRRFYSNIICFASGEQSKGGKSAEARPALGGGFRHPSVRFASRRPNTGAPCSTSAAAAKTKVAEMGQTMTMRCGQIKPSSGATPDHRTQLRSPQPD